MYTFLKVVINKHTKIFRANKIQCAVNNNEYLIIIQMMIYTLLILSRDKIHISNPHFIKHIKQ